MTDEEKAKATDAYEQHLQSHPDGQFTFGQMVGLGDRAVGRAATYRHADQWIQKQRRAGRIKQAKRGVWVLA